jgi:RNA polymerase sigma factor (sigma-70 family)
VIAARVRSVARIDTHSRRLESLVQDEGQALVRFAFLLTGGDAPLADDLVQGVLARLVSRGIDDLADPVSYARRAVVNEYRSLHRRRQTHERALTRIGPVSSGTATSSIEDRDAVLRALLDLSERERAAVVLRYFADLDDGAIATELGCARVTVRSLVHRALRKLRPLLEPAFRGGSDPQEER